MGGVNTSRILSNSLEFVNNSEPFSLIDVFKKGLAYLTCVKFDYEARFFSNALSFDS